MANYGGEKQRKAEAGKQVIQKKNMRNLSGLDLQDDSSRGRRVKKAVGSTQITE